MLFRSLTVLILYAVNSTSRAEILLWRNKQFPKPIALTQTMGDRCETVALYPSLIVATLASLFPLWYMVVLATMARCTYSRSPSQCRLAVQSRPYPRGYHRQESEAEGRQTRSAPNDG
jgi:hypothetical protein